LLYFTSSLNCFAAPYSSYTIPPYLATPNLAIS